MHITFLDAQSFYDFYIIHLSHFRLEDIFCNAIRTSVPCGVSILSYYWRIRSCPRLAAEDQVSLSHSVSWSQGTIWYLRQEETLARFHLFWTEYRLPPAHLSRLGHKVNEKANLYHNGLPCNKITSPLKLNFKVEV